MQWMKSMKFIDEMKHSIGSDNPYDNDSRIGQQVISVILSMILSILSMDG